MSGELKNWLCKSPWIIANYLRKLIRTHSETSMNISSVEEILVDIPYVERIRDHLHKGWSYANRATDEEFQEKESEYRREWEESSTPTAKTTPSARREGLPT